MSFLILIIHVLAVVVVVVAVVGVIVKYCLSVPLLLRSLRFLMLTSSVFLLWMEFGDCHSCQYLRLIIAHYDFISLLHIIVYHRCRRHP